MLPAGRAESLAGLTGFKTHSGSGSVWSRGGLGNIVLERSPDAMCRVDGVGTRAKAGGPGDMGREVG